MTRPAALDPTVPLAPGDVVSGELGGRYVVEAALGASAVAPSFRAAGPAGEAVVVKVFRPEQLGRFGGSADEVVQRLLEHATLFAALGVPSLRSPIDFGVLTKPRRAAAVFWVTSFLPGRPLAELELRSLRESLRVLDAVAEVVGALAARGLQHGNLRPSNVLLAGSGEIVVLDAMPLLGEGAASVDARGLAGLVASCLAPAPTPAGEDVTSGLLDAARLPADWLDRAKVRPVQESVALAALAGAELATWWESTRALLRAALERPRGPAVDVQDVEGASGLRIAALSRGGRRIVAASATEVFLLELGEPATPRWRSWPLGEEGFVPRGLHVGEEVITLIDERRVLRFASNGTALATSSDSELELRALFAGVDRVTGAEELRLLGVDAARDEAVVQTVSSAPFGVREVVEGASGARAALTLESGELLLVGDRGLVLRVSGRGSERLAWEGRADLLAMTPGARPGDVHVVGAGGSAAILEGLDGAASSRPEAVESTEALRAVALDSFGVPWALGEGSRVLRRRRDGVWELARLGGDFEPIALFPHGKSVLFVGADGRLARVRPSPIADRVE